jgi:hypothetical protein
MERRGTIINNADRRCRLSQLTQPYKGRGRINGASVMLHVHGLQLGRSPASSQRRYPVGIPHASQRRRALVKSHGARKPARCELARDSRTVAASTGQPANNAPHIGCTLVDACSTAHALILACFSAVVEQHGGEALEVQTGRHGASCSICGDTAAPSSSVCPRRVVHAYLAGSPGTSTVMAINKHRPGPGVPCCERPAHRSRKSLNPPEGHVLIQLDLHETNHCSGPSRMQRDLVRFAKICDISR